MKQELEKKLEDFKKQIEDLKEFECFLNIEGIGGIKWRENHDHADGRFEISEVDFQENQEYYQALLNECVLMLKKFNVDPESIKDKPKGDYWTWYVFWKKWMLEFSDKEWNDFQKKYEKKENIEDQLPKKKWNE